MDLHTLQQTWPLPGDPIPIAIVGAGGIVNDAHLPAYAKADLPLRGIYDMDRSRSAATAERFGIAKVFDSLAEIFEDEDVIFDIAVPPEAIVELLEEIPAGAAVLLQKPMGIDLENAKEILRICREKKLVAAANFQLRFSPMMLALRDVAARGWLGEIVDVEVRLNSRTPWEIFPFLKTLARVEIQVHSIHYLDWIRSLLGEPAGVYARSVGHPRFPELRTTRTSAILDYGDQVRCCLTINHNYENGPKHQAATIKVEGLKGTAMMKMGVLLNYPKGEPDELEIAFEGDTWSAVALEGNWFPDAFLGTMSNLQRFAAGEDEVLLTGVEDAIHTMALVEACYESDARGATPIPEC